MSQMESMFMGHFQITLNPREFWLRKIGAEFLYTHTLSYLVPSFERFLMTPLSARSTLVSEFYSDKKSDFKWLYSHKSFDTQEILG